MLGTLARWLVIATVTFSAALLAALAALLFWSRHVTAPTRGGISAGEYFGGHLPVLLLAGRAGLLGLAATGLYWALGLLLVPALRARVGGGLAMKASLVLAPLWLALVYATVLLAGEDPATLFPRRQ